MPNKRAMLKIIFFDGREMTFSPDWALAQVIHIAEGFNGAYQVVKNNKEQSLMWEREAPGVND